MDKKMKFTLSSFAIWLLGFIMISILADFIGFPAWLSILITAPIIYCTQYVVHDRWTFNKNGSEKHG